MKVGPSAQRSIVLTLVDERRIGPVAALIGKPVSHKLGFFNIPQTRMFWVFVI